MTWFKNLRTVAKLLVGFVLMAVLMGVVGTMGLSGMDRIDQMVETLYKRDLVGLVAAENAQVAIVSAGRDVRALVIETDQTVRQRLHGDVDKHLQTLSASLEEVEKTLATEASRARVADARSRVGEYARLIKQAAALALARKDAEAHESIRQSREVRDAMQAAVEQVVDTKQKLAAEAAHESTEIYTSLRQRLVIIVVVSVLAAIAFGLFIGRLIARPLGQAVDVLQALSAGDFTRRLEVDTRDEVGRMAAALNDAADRMREALAEVRGVSADVASASDELTSSSTEISSGAQEQASSLEETAANLEQITMMVRRNSENAQQANRLAAGSREAAEAGGRSVQATIGAMTEISAASRRIADIISTIDEIAFQTNLLALNAAVEAARAGEQGRGFAVVASEVRGLAQRTASAAKEIKVLIQDSVQKVENGSHQVAQSGETLEQIVNSVKRLTDIVGEIAAASGEQTTGIEQVNTAVTQMDTVTQANASQTEELSATAESLNGRATQLRQLVERFKLDRDGAARVAPVSAPAPARRPARPAARVAPMRRPAALPAASEGLLSSPSDGFAGGTGAGSGRTGSGTMDGFEEF
jgi:methyl-accepting chemotaxis protein